jgi:hypothetical protein
VNTITRISLAGIVLLAVIPSCGGSEDASQATGAELFPAEIASTGWSRAQKILSFPGDSLFEYINGAAEMYHKYGFIDVKVAAYHKQDDEIIGCRGVLPRTYSRVRQGAVSRQPDKLR